jgi:hypothetical protein
LELHCIVEHLNHLRFEKLERLCLEVKENILPILHDFPLLKRMKIILNSRSDKVPEIKADRVNILSIFCAHYNLFPV